jgi:hypothetical protein
VARSLLHCCLCIVLRSVALSWCSGTGSLAPLGESNYRPANGKNLRPVLAGQAFLKPQFAERKFAQRVAPLLSINSLMRPRTEADNAETQHREDSNIEQCINHGSLH